MRDPNLPSVQSRSIKVLEHYSVYPAAGSAAPKVLPLTFFDYIFLPFHPVQRLFFFNLPISVQDFLTVHLSTLKTSLSLALRDFRPLAGTLVLDGPPNKPEIHCSDTDSVPFIIAESVDNFQDLTANRGKHISRLWLLVPELLNSSGTSDKIGTIQRRSAPILALQITLFPDVGFSLGITVSHAVADGNTSAHFLKAWASYSRRGIIPPPPPCYDRDIIINGYQSLHEKFLKDLDLFKEDKRFKCLDLHGKDDDVILSTFFFSGDEIKRLAGDCSAYAAVAGFIWACLVKARAKPRPNNEYFGFVTGCRARLKPPLKQSYFGNCLGLCMVEAKGEELEGDNGPVVGSALIWRRIMGLEEGPLRGAQSWVQDIYRLAGEGILTVAGSPKLGLYQVDFGWGRPVKIEIVSIERTGAMSMAEGAEDERGLEIGMALPKEIMDRFRDVVAASLAKSPCP